MPVTTNVTGKTVGVPIVNPLGPLARMRAAMLKARLGNPRKKKLVMADEVRKAAKLKMAQNSGISEEKKGMSGVAKAGIGASIIAVLAAIVGVKYLVK